MGTSDICIIGAGQAGLQLALGLQAAGLDVRLVGERSPEQVAGGRVMSSQCMFNSALSHERALSLDLWTDAAPQIKAIDVAVSDQGRRPPSS